METDSLLGVIPARMGSSRFPGKVLAKITNMPMIQYVWRSASQSQLGTNLWVATDSDEIKNAVFQFGGRVWMTPGYFSSGTDRVAFVAKAEGRSNIIVNIQADEPLISPRHLNLLVETLKKNPKCCIATLCVKKDSRVELHDQNVVKVEFSPTGDATIFSRVPTSQGTVFYKHIGIYAYRKETLDLFCHLKPSIQEQEERLEQLRAIAYGIPIRVIEIDQDTVAVDNPSDIMKVEQFLKMTQNPANEPEERKFL